MDILKPILLIDKTRLQEIYDLRVDAWQNSKGSDLVNRTLFPAGWKDSLDDISIHWIVQDNDNEIIAAARLTLAFNFNEVEYLGDALPNDFKVNFPFGYYSRLVIHPKYRGRGYSTLLDRVRLQFIADKKIKHSLASAEKKRAIHLKKYGFEIFGLRPIAITNKSPLSERYIIFLDLNKLNLPKENCSVKSLLQTDN